LLMPYWQQAGIDTEKFTKEYLAAITALEKERLKKLSEIGDRTKYFFARPDYDPALLIWKKADKDKTRQALSDLNDLYSQLDKPKFTKTDLEPIVKQMIADKNYDNGSVLWPLRTALTGLDKSPGPFEVAATLALGLGKSELLERIKIAINKLS
jgi:glutamyl/glutaminyl-tRNA synthetase